MPHTLFEFSAMNCPEAGVTSRGRPELHGRSKTSRTNSTSNAESVPAQLHPRFDDLLRPALGERTVRRGLTLVEMLIATVITLVMMAAVVFAFGLINDAIIYSRSTVEMTDRLRAAKERLQQDLNQVTATMIPSLKPEADEGYLEYVEGWWSDSTLMSRVRPDEGAQAGGTFSGQVQPKMMELSKTIVGDTDDILMFTVRSTGRPFVARLSDGRTVESYVAEIAYYVVPEQITPSGGGPPEPAPFYPRNAPNGPGGLLCRQVRLVKPELGQSTDLEPSLSMRYGKIAGNNSRPAWICNGLGDLTKRENRMAHWNPLFENPDNPPQRFPYPVLRGSSDANRQQRFPFSGLEQFTDLLLTNVLAFDVQAYDPTAPVLDAGDGTPVLPSDPNYAQRAFEVARDRDWSKLWLGRGAWVDLMYLRTIGSPHAELFPADAAGNPLGFWGPPHTKSGLRLPPVGASQLSAANMTAVYDTWSWHYDQDGVDTDNDGVIDQAINGIDDLPRPPEIHDPAPDDVGERETRPPYDVPLRGLRVTIRTIEPDTLEVRQVTVQAEFLPD